MSPAPTQWEHVADTDELNDGDRKSIFVDDTPALLLRVAGTYYAIEDVCTHDGQPLTDGPVDGNSISCPRHGARFDLKTGKALCMPATQAIQTFAIDVRDDGIYAAVGSTEDILPATGANVSDPVVAQEVAKAEATASAAGAVVEKGAEQTAADTAENSSEEASDLEIIEALRQVIDPELMVNIVDLGLIYSVNHSERKALVEMTLTSPACPAGPQIVSQAKMVIERLSGIDEAQIKLTMSPPWTPDRMTDEARDQLGFF